MSYLDINSQEISILLCLKIVFFVCEKGNVVIKVCIHRILDFQNYVFGKGSSSLYQSLF